jgi:phospholipid transport system substrate-binding protein
VDNKSRKEYILMKPACGQNGSSVKTRRCLPVILLLLTCIVAVPWSAVGGTPLEELKSTVDRITGILDDKAMRESLGSDALLAKLKEVSQDGFDWEEIAERALGLYWKERTAEEKSEFTRLLKNLLLDSYLTKIIDNYSGESVVFDKEIVEGERAQVESRILNKAEKSIVIGARLMRKDNKWLVYDLIIEGVSSLKNYRAQFYDIIRQSSYSELLKRLKEKQKVEPAAS